MVENKQKKKPLTHALMHMFNIWPTCREHLLVEARGSDRYIKVSNVRDLRWQVIHCTVDLNCPWNSATMMDSFSSLCLLQARSAAVWSSIWSFSSSLYRFLLSAWHQRRKNNMIGTKEQLQPAFMTPLKLNDWWQIQNTLVIIIIFHLALKKQNLLSNKDWIIKWQTLYSTTLTSLSFSSACSSASSLSLW